jgi:MFS family permease
VRAHDAGRWPEAAADFGETAQGEPGLTGDADGVLDAGAGNTERIGILERTTAPLAAARRGYADLRASPEGRERLRIILLLSAVLGLNSADLGTVGAVAAELEHGLRIGDLDVGLAASAVSVAAALATLPIGWLTDRMPRVPLMAGSIVLWSGAMVATGAATSFPMLVGSRIFLGAVQATSGPTLAALTGDLFPERERSRIFGFVHAGELIGAGFGFVVSGEVAAVLSWRWSFWLLSVPGFLLALAVWRGLPEPERGQRGHPEAGAGGTHDDPVRTLVRRRRVKPDPGLVLEADPDHLPVREAAGYLLRIPTNLVLIGALSMGYFFLGGAQTFGVIFFRGHFHLSQAAATATSATLGIGALAGVVGAGRLADRMLSRGRLDARLTVSAVGYLAAVAVFVPGILVPSLAIGLPILVLAAAALMAPSAPLDAALLDVIPPALWGRAEGIQTAVRTLAMAAAPVLFGLTSDLLGETGSHGLGQSAVAGKANSGAQGLAATLLIMLAPIAVAGVALWVARSRYPRDVASVNAVAAPQ